MPLASKLAFRFDKRVQLKAQGLYAARAVQVIEESSQHFWAQVQGSLLYQVHLTYKQNSLRVSCECAYDDFGRCKHIWASILQADRRGALSAAANARYLTLENGSTHDGLYWKPGIQPLRDPTPSLPPPPPTWQKHLTEIRRVLDQKGAGVTKWPRDLDIVYVIDAAASQASAAIALELFSRTRKKNGEWTALKEFRVSPAQIATLPDPVDVDALTLVQGGQESYGYQNYAMPRRKLLSTTLAARLVPVLASAGRLALKAGGVMAEPKPVQWDAGQPWRLWLQVQQVQPAQPNQPGEWSISGSLRRGEERMQLSEPLLTVEGGFVFARGLVAPLHDDGTFPWFAQLKNLRQISFPDADRDRVLAGLLDCAAVPPLELDQAVQFEERRATPGLGLKVTQKREPWGDDYFQANLLFDYGRGWMEELSASRGVWLAEERVYLVRDAAAEDAARETLKSLGLRPAPQIPLWRLSAKSLPRVVRELIHAGWHVEAEGKAFRRPGATRVDVRSGIDWFELHGEVDYGDATASLPALLAALRRGDGMVPLGDGGFGLLPEEWLKRFAPLAGLGSREADHLRFRRNQAGLLDALLAAQPEVRVDEIFQRVRDRILDFQGVTAAPQPEGFSGHLRDYQREGLGWMEFLRDFGFGGCLADDMGVGKTAQVLAVLENRRALGKGPSLVVAPKSLMFNWRAESARFTPRLKVLEHTGMARDADLFPKHDLVLTTYGTMLRDAAQLAEVEFDYVVLDEAQAIKNANTAQAKAVRLLRAGHRLALSGTPVENHLGELWSIFEFLNPGMLGEAKVLKMAGGLARNPGEEARRLLAHALRPFILRRTKQQVARELPEKTEQTIYCELEGPQRKQYDELRKHFRDQLLLRVDEEGLGRSKMQVLEALLRLRQAACHPGLLDPKRSGEPSAKLDVLLYHLEDLRQEGHKALVFSQFTSLLAIVRARLDAKGVRYEYLDGATRNRQEHVDAFQNDPDCGLFLISLKAGGLGLNLTAAEYVFLLDPWWNPAVEAQAVDRAHRIGQTRAVFAYRLIARDTVEEKVLELQKTKRDLADAILGEDNSLIRDLKREDLELLLS